MKRESILAAILLAGGGTIVMSAVGCGFLGNPILPSRSESGAAPGTFSLAVTQRSPSFGTAFDFARCLSGVSDAFCFTAAASGRIAAAGAAAATAPGMPGTLTVGVDGGTVTLTWSAPTTGDRATSYIIEAGSAPGAKNLANFSTGTTATTYSASGVGAGTYYVRVRAQSPGSNSDPSNEVLVIVGSVGCTAPGVPSGLSSSASGTTVTLTWSAASGSPTSYVLEAGSSSGASNLLVSDLGSPATSLTATAGAGTYYVRLRSKNACGTSAASSDIVVVVGGTGLSKCDTIKRSMALFSETASVTCDGSYAYVSSQGVPQRQMMTGITNTNQQVPIPQDYTSSNAWKIPLDPVASASPVAFDVFNGPIGVAINGVPIFNPNKPGRNGPEDTKAAGELDVCGGHAGRADDYHYHVAPDCLTGFDANAQPFGWALDGYAMYGYRRANGTTPARDACGGEIDPLAGDYRYHAIPTYPYLIACFTGRVVDRIPNFGGVRPAGEPLAVTNVIFVTDADGYQRMTYTSSGGTQSIRYKRATDVCWDFEFIDTADGRTANRYCR